MSAPTTHEIGLDTPDPPSLGTVRAWIRRVLSGVDPATVSDVELVITELATNAREHASGPRRIRLARDTNTIRVEVDDTDPDTRPIERAFSTSAYRGRGLLLVTSLCAAWGTNHHRGSKTVWARLTFGA